MSRSSSYSSIDTDPHAKVMLLTGYMWALPFELPLIFYYYFITYIFVIIVVFPQVHRKFYSFIHFYLSHIKKENMRSLLPMAI